MLHFLDQFYSRESGICVALLSVLCTMVQNALWKDEDPKEPVLFLKPTTSYVTAPDALQLPPAIGKVHHEARRLRPGGL